MSDRSPNVMWIRGLQHACAALLIVVGGIGAASSPADAVHSREGHAVPHEFQPPPPPGSGYWMMSSFGTVYGFGTAPVCGDHQPQFAPREATAIISTPRGGGYYTLSDDGIALLHMCGKVYDVCAGCPGGANFLLRFGERAVSLSELPDGTGLWEFTDQGRVLIVAPAKSYGDLSHTRLN